MSILPASAAPAIELSPDRGPAGSSVNIEGSGFVALSTVTLTFDKRSLSTVPETIVVDALGKFEAAFKVPDSADEGENLVVATAEIILDNDNDGEKHDDEDDDKRDRRDKERDRDDGDDERDREDDEDDGDESKDDEDDDRGRDRDDRDEKDDDDRDRDDDKPRNFIRHKASTTFTVVIDANSEPVAQSLSVTTREERPVKIVLQGSDDDGDEISFAIVDDPQHGELRDFSASTGTVTYVPFHDYHGKDSFGFKVNDGKEESDSAEVTVTVTSSTSRSRSGGGSPDPVPEVPDDTSVETEVVVTETTEASQQPAGGVIDQYITDFIETSQAASTGTNSFLTIVTSTAIAETTDSQPPKLILPASPLEVGAVSPSGARVSYSASALDDFDGELTPFCSPESGYQFPVGTVNVVCKVTDSAGNTALASFVVAVKQSAQEESPSVLLPFLIMGIVGAASFGGFWALTRAREE
jgi:hypothetical protein